MNKYSWRSSQNNKLAASPELIEDEEAAAEGESSYSDSPEESSSWTEILDGYSDYVRRIEAAGDADQMKQSGDDDHKHKHKKINCDNCVNNIDNNDDGGGSDSMVSDAGSGPKWRHHQLMTMMMMNHHSYTSTPNYNIPRKLNFKSKRSANNCKEVPYDDSLEDTASSPVNSPKLTMGLTRMELNTRTGTDQENINFDNRFIGKSGDDYDDLVDHQENRHADHDEKITEATKKNINCDVVQNFNKELQNRGMCIVPVSMLPTINHINYHIDREC